MNDLSSFLCCIGDAAERLLPGLFTAFSCCAAPSAGDLDIFCLSSGKNGIEETGALASDLTAIHHLTQPKENRSLFPCTFKLDTCSPLFRSAHEMSETPETSLLFSVLRGKGLPFSYQTDREAVEWAFSDLLSRPDDPSILPFIRWLEKISTVPDSEDVRLTCMADLSDPFSAGIALSFLCHTDRYFKNRPVSVYFIALAEPRSPLPDSFVSTLYGSLQAMEERKLLRSVDDAAERCVEAAWILSMPSSMIESTDSFLFLAPFAARIIGKISGRNDPPSPGLHTVETEGLLSLSMLRENAGDFAEAMSLFVWLVSDILPAAQNYLSRPARLRSISVNLRTSVFRRVFSSQSSGGNLEDTLRLIERTVKKLISLVLRYLRSVPSSLRLTPENAELWQKAVDACGRTVTVAAEYDLSSSEAHESGLDAVRPVHRVSMADTDEEQLIHRLEDIKAQLDNETKARNAVLSSLGGYRSIQVRMDCLNRCKKALNDAQAKAAAVSVSADRLAVLKLERRIRLLTAAVSRCESELTPESLSAAVSLPPQAGRPDKDPYLGTVFIPESCHIL